MVDRHWTVSSDIIQIFSFWISMPLLYGMQVAKEVDRHPPPRSPAIVICSVEREPAIVEAALEAGVLGYVFKTSVAKDLIPAIRAAARGRSFVSQR